MKHLRILEYVDEVARCGSIRKAAEFLEKRASRAPFGGAMRQALPAAERRAFVAGFAPLLRGKLSGGVRKLAHFDDSADVLAFVDSKRCAELAELGTSCPDHFLRTKIRPVVLDANADGEAIDAALARYRAEYESYYARCKRPDRGLPSLGLSRAQGQGPASGAHREVWHRLI